MPVFTAGSGLCPRRRSTLLARAVFTTRATRQGTSCAPRMEGAGALPAGPHLALHLSGGTTEVLACAREDWSISNFSAAPTTCTPASSSTAWACGMGLSFPAGPALEKLGRGRERPKAPSRSSHRPRAEVLLLRGRGAGHAHGWTAGGFSPRARWRRRSIPTWPARWHGSLTWAYAERRACGAALICRGRGLLAALPRELLRARIRRS